MFKVMFILLGYVVTSIGFAEPNALKMHEVAPGIYVHYGVHEITNTHNHGAIANIGFIVGKRCVAVIDSGGNPQQGYALRNAIKAVTALPVCYVINTHVHPDHIFGNRAFKKSGAKFVGHHKLPRAMAMRGDFYIQRSVEMLGVKLGKQDIVPPNILVQKTLTLDLGNRQLLLTAHPTAHTDNDVSVYDSQTETLWLSDLLFITHLPVLDGSLKGWIKELQGLKARSLQRVIPGHGPVASNWPQALIPEQAYLQLLLDDTRKAIQQGVFLEDALNTVGQSANTAQWLLFEQFHRKNVSSAFAELEWEN